MQPGLLLAILLAATAAPAAAADIDFARDVQPLLKRHCLRCHNDQRRMGGLSLETREKAQSGGASRLNPLAADADNELLRRVRAEHADERMPFESPALSPAEIDLLARWIQSGAAWPQPPPASTAAAKSEPKTWLELVSGWIDLWDRLKLDRLRPASLAMVGVLLLVLVLERAKKWAARRAAAGRPAGAWATIAGAPRVAYLAAALAVVVYGLAVYSRGLSADLQETNRTLKTTQQELQTLTSAAHLPGSFATNEIYWPKHPPRLGGQYYRGNDERSAALFNGGVYLTATFDLELRDGSDSVLQPGNMPEGPLQIRLQIRKAPHATEQLFSESSLDEVCLSPIPPPKTNQAAKSEPPDTGGPYLLQVVEPGECWELRAELSAIPANQPLAGMLYLYTNRKQRPDDSVVQPHYAIDYRLELDGEGRLTKDSRLHLGSMYNVPSVFAIPVDRIAPSEWFDYRPLPAIEGEREM